MTFGRNDSKKVSNNICFLPLHLTNTSTIPGETGNRLHIFTSMLHAVLQKNARNTLRYNKWSQLSKRLTVCSRQDPWEGDLASCSILPSPLTLDVYQVCHCVDRCVKDRSCSSSSIEWKSVDSIAGISYYVNKMLDAINAQLMTILSFSNTVHQCILRST